jgi:hypothetical protein
MAGYGLDDRRSVPGRDGDLYFPTATRLVLESTHYPIQQVLGALSSELKVKVKLSLCLTKHDAMKAYYWGSGGIAPRILDLGTRWR